MDDSMDRSLDKLHVKPKFDAPEEDDHIQQQSYVTVLEEEDIWSRLENEIQSVANVFCLSKTEATLLLSYFHWDVSKFVDEWFDDPTSVRERVGILEMSLDQSSNDEEFFCGGCYKFHKLENSASVSCGHRVCTNCWTSHISKVFNETSKWNVWLKCPYVPCQASVGRDMIESFASEEDKTKYERYLLKSYVEESKTMKLCPRAASGRSCTIDLTRGDSRNSGVYCVCLLKFCWNCSKDVHSPVDCETAAKWLAMTMSGYQNPNRPLANTVPCPKCKQRTAENQYVLAEIFSLKMKCLPCNYEFCWLCRGDWTEHDEETCNNDAVPCDYEETDSLWRMEEFSIDKYKECYENWQSNDLLMQRAIAKLQQLRNVDLPKLSEIQLPTVQQLDFITEAALQVTESRRILKWTYAYQYYLSDDKQDLLKIKQEYVKLLLKKLNDCIETDMSLFLNAEGSSENFHAFRIKLTGLTRTTRIYNETLIRDLEDGLANGYGLNHDD
ncbi:hypothetical protein AALP_AA1G055600 [Arabis alpina]|uniref:RBR-type E3 ubiquitin transferase n=1 Tax=Arabis alpina TaxID=50452 RepID=A0A087HLB8_ARAAL|nr:hypothetical protein AALP_AA1G055600 [Arabis alpina]